MLLDLSIELRLILSITTSLLLALLLKYPIHYVAIKKECLEKENGRTSHKGKIPNLGGAMIYFSFLTSSLLFVKFAAADLQYVFLSFSVLFALGFYDDVIVISYRKKFQGEFVGAVLLIIGNVYLTNFHGLFGFHQLSLYFSIPFTIIMILGIVNAMNLIDGIDGLCSGLSALIIASFSLWLFNNGFIEYGIVGLSLTAAIIPFFVFNVFGKKTKMFLGDNGSLFLGMVISFLVIKFCELNIGNNSWQNVQNAPAIAFTIIAIPVLDTLRVFVTRILNKKSPYRPDKTHFHHKFLEYYDGNHKKATFTIIGIQLLFIILAFCGSSLPGETLITISIVLYLAFYFGIIYLNARKRKNVVKAVYD